MPPLSPLEIEGLQNEEMVADVARLDGILAAAAALEGLE
jgi:hypothetical protein